MQLPVGIWLGRWRERPLVLVQRCMNVGSTPGLDDFYLTNLQGNPWQTAVCASRLILSGTLDALPELDLVLVHGGGHLLYQIGRLDHGHRVRPEAAVSQQLPREYLRRFHYDTLTHRAEVTRWLVDQVGTDRVLFGTDMPFDMGGRSLDHQLASVSSFLCKRAWSGVS